MKSILFIFTRAFVLFILAAAVAVPCFAAQDKDKDKAPQVSKAEQDAAMKIQSAPDAAAKLKAAADFIKKYPKSTQRAAVVGTVVEAITKAPDDAQKISGLENALTVFKEPVDAEIISPILFNSYVKANRLDDAFAFVQKDLATNANDLAMLTQATLLGTEQAKKQNGKYVSQSQQYGAKAIQIIESGNKPATLNDDSWKEYQTKMLPQLYLSLGLLSLMTQNSDDARAKLQKAASLNPQDPFTFYLLGTVLNDEYMKIRDSYMKQSAGPMKDSLLKDAQAKLDQVIEMWAHSLAIAQGNPSYEAFGGQLRPELESYYKSRHGSTDGLDALITKYKKQ